MIYLLEFTGSLYEFKNSHGRTSIALHKIVKMRPDMMILHRYDLFFHFDKKFQTNDPDKIDLTRLDGKNAMLYHLDVYTGCSEKIEPLMRGNFGVWAGNFRSGLFTMSATCISRIKFTGPSTR